MPPLIAKLKAFAFKNAFPLIIVLVCIVLAYKNYTPGTWQTGWDTLHPEFSWQINIPRHLFGMWQENQGLGSVGGHSHAADISRILILFTGSLFLPLSFLRYGYLFLTLIAGPLGVYFFLDKAVFASISPKLKRNFLSAFGALFYLFNLGTVEQYYVPLEMYTALYGFLPWCFLASLKFLEEGRKKLLYLVLAFFLAAPMAYAITVFVSFYLILFIFLASTAFIMYQKGDKAVLKRFFLVNLLILLLNSYWLVPSLYYGFKHSKLVSYSKINTHFSDRIYDYNVSHGNLEDLLFVKGFLIEWSDFSFSENRFIGLMPDWTRHLYENEDIKVIGYGLGILLFLGLVYSFFRKSRFTPGLALGLFVSAFMFLTSNPPFGIIFVWIRDLLPLFSEIFRNSFTKFSVELIFAYSIFASFGVLLLLQFVEKLGEGKPRKLLISFFVLSLILFSYYMAPMYSGKLVSTDVRQKIPNYYFELFSWMNSQNDSRRVATLPIHTFTGWTYYKWGYQGAGFIWFGLKQSVLDRDFDRWNPFNEEYYYEMSRAVYSQSVVDLERVITKYGIGYILFDSDVIGPEFSSKSTYTEATEKLLSSSQLLTKEQVFGSVFVYKVKDGGDSDFYTQSSNVSHVYTYPFKDTIMEHPGGPRKYVVGDGEVTIKQNVALDQENLNLDISNYGLENLVPVLIYAKNEADKISVKVVYNFPKLFINSKEVLNTTDTFRVFEAPVLKPTSTNLVLAVGGSFFELTALTNNYKELGGALLFAKKENLLRLFSKANGRTLDLLSGDGTLAECQEGDSDVFISKNYLSLISRTEKACVSKALPLANGSYLFETNVTYTSELKDSPYYCIGEAGNCFSNVLQNLKLNSLEAETTKDYMVWQNTGNPTLFQVFTKPDPELGVSKVDFSRLVLSYYPEVVNFRLTGEEIANDLLAKLKPISFSTDSSKTAILEAKIDTKSLNYGLADEALFMSSHLAYENNETFTKDFRSGIYTKIANYSVYDAVQMPKIPRNTYYLGLFKSRNLDGRPLTISIDDYNSGRRFVLEKLDQPAKVVTLQNGDTRNGYVVGFDSSSIGISNPSENVFESFKLAPYPGLWLSGITIATPGEKGTARHVDNSQIKKIAPFLYFVSEARPNDLLIFKQSFESGWLAIGGRDHNLYEGWANSWRVERNFVIVLFWPALIQIGGYGVFIAILILGLKDVAASKAQTQPKKGLSKTNSTHNI